MHDRTRVCGWQCHKSCDHVVSVILQMRIITHLQIYPVLHKSHQGRYARPKSYIVPDFPPIDITWHGAALYGAPREEIIFISLLQRVFSLDDSFTSLVNYVIYLPARGLIDSTSAGGSGDPARCEKRRKEGKKGGFNVPLAASSSSFWIITFNAGSTKGDTCYARPAILTQITRCDLFRAGCPKNFIFHLFPRRLRHKVLLSFPRQAEISTG